MIKLFGHLTPGTVPSCHIYLNGLPQAYVVEAHTEEGWIIRCKLDSDGHVYAEGDEVATEKLAGAVSAVLMEIVK